MNVFRRMSTSFVVVLPLLTFIPAQAEKIAFVATDLVDVTPGEDLWRYDYTVSGSHNFAQFEFFDIFFDPSLYGALSDASAPNGDWDVLILQQPNPINLPPLRITSTCYTNKQGRAGPASGYLARRQLPRREVTSADGSSPQGGGPGSTASARSSTPSPATTRYTWSAACATC